MLVNENNNGGQSGNNERSPKFIVGLSSSLVDLVKVEAVDGKQRAHTCAGHR